jgi:hypothetical protein
VNSSNCIIGVYRQLVIDITLIEHSNDVFLANVTMVFHRVEFCVFWEGGTTQLGWETISSSLWVTSKVVDYRGSWIIK